MSRRKLTGRGADEALMSGLSGTARKLAVDGGSIDQAASILFGMADGRSDLLAEAGAVSVGFWSYRPIKQHPVDLLGAALLVRASRPLPLDDLGRWVEEGRYRAGAPRPDLALRRNDG